MYGVRPYEHSGRLGAGAPLVVLGGVAASTLLAYPYAFIDVYSPIVGYISVFFVAGYAIALCWVVAWLGRYAKVRRPAFLQLAGLETAAPGEPHVGVSIQRCPTCNAAPVYEVEYVDYEVEHGVQKEKRGSSVGLLELPADALPGLEALAGH